LPKVFKESVKAGSYKTVVFGEATQWKGMLGQELALTAETATDDLSNQLSADSD